MKYQIANTVCRRLVQAASRFGIGPQELHALGSLLTCDGIADDWETLSRLADLAGLPWPQMFRSAEIPEAGTCRICGCAGTSECEWLDESRTLCSRHEHCEIIHTQIDIPAGGNQDLDFIWPHLVVTDELWLGPHGEGDSIAPVEIPVFHVGVNVFQGILGSNNRFAVGACMAWPFRFIVEPGTRIDVRVCNYSKWPQSVRIGIWAYRDRRMPVIR
jgi:hypothetical protein